MTELPAGYLLPWGWTMTDVRRLDEEIMDRDLHRKMAKDNLAARLHNAARFLQEVKEADGPGN